MFGPSEEVKSAILLMVRRFPSINRKLSERGKEKAEEWEEMQRKVEEKTGEKVEISLLQSIVYNAKCSLPSFLRKCIVIDKLNKQEVTISLATWKNFECFGFYRSAIKEYEDELWREQAMKGGPENTVLDPDLEDLDHMEWDDNGRIRGEAKPIAPPIATVISVNGLQSLVKHFKSIKVVPKFTADIPIACHEAIKANGEGTAKLHRKYPNVPWRKYEDRMFRIHGMREQKTYPVQVVFQKPGSPDEFFVFFEGWTTSYCYPKAEVETLWPEALETAILREKYLESIKGAQIDGIGGLEDYRARCSGYNMEMLFWDYQDLEYFHTKIHKEYGFGNIIYVTLPNYIHAPKFAYINTYTMEVDMYNKFLQDYYKTFDEIKNWKDKSKVSKARRQRMGRGGCESKSCVCNEIFWKLFDKDGCQNLLLNSEGLLNFSGFQEEVRRISIECSDRCGCSRQCPRRRSQQGTTLFTAVQYECAQKGFGLRVVAPEVKKGQFLGMITGKLKRGDEKDDQSYYVDLEVFGQNLVICALKQGNVYRFMSHSCEPTAVFVPCYSRKSEEDPLIPQCAVYAMKDMVMGDEITVRYYNENGPPGEKRTVECLCNTKSCMKYLPG